MDVLIPVEKGTEWNRERLLGSLPLGTRYSVGEYDSGDAAEAMSALVQNSQSDLVYLGAPDAWVDRELGTLRFMEDQSWNADVVYGPLVQWVDGQPAWMQGREHFCPNRLYRENYIPGVACVRRDAFLEAGGLTSGMWDLYVRMHENGARIKYVPEAVSARDNQQPDPSPQPTPKDVLATFYYQATPGTTYWRCLLPARYLPGQAIFNHPVRIQDEQGKLAFPQHQGTAVFQFAGDEAHFLLMKTFQERGIRCLIEVDDNYAHWIKDKMGKAGWVETIKESLVQTDNGLQPGKYSVECHRETVKAADGVIVASHMLEKQYRKLNDNVFVCENQIDPADWPEPEKPDDGVFRIGWFASASHSPDIRLIERAIRWAGAQPNVQVQIMGVGPFPGLPYYQIPWSNDLGVYRKMMGQIDLGLAPIVAQPWAQFRSDLKVLENAMGGAATIASEGPVYQHCQVPHLRLCKTPKDWLYAVQEAVRDPDGWREKGREAREYVLANRTVPARIGDWELAIAA